MRILDPQAAELTINVIAKEFIKAFPFSQDKATAILRLFLDARANKARGGSYWRVIMQKVFTTQKRKATISFLVKITDEFERANQCRIIPEKLSLETLNHLFLQLEDGDEIKPKD